MAQKYFFLKKPKATYCVQGANLLAEDLLNQNYLQYNNYVIIILSYT